MFNFIEQLNGKKATQIKIGDKVEFSKTITETDVYLFAGVTLDFNPAHINEVKSSQTIFKTRIAHGMITQGLISATASNLLPGPGSLIKKQLIVFKAPVYFNDTITIELEVIKITGFDIHLNVIVKNQDEVIVTTGSLVTTTFEEVYNG